jgi:insulysin
MDVHVGACSDPDDVPGLAHFCEHMLFLGTEKYPQEDSFESFLSANGGSSNAFTDNENTVYFFDMQAEADVKFKEGLSRFGSFFSAPLFTESATSRELNAIESENAKNLQSDIFRFYQIEKSRANPKHPYSKFFTGNKKTLLDNTRQKGIDLRQELINFYNKYYSANQMTLAIVAPQSISTLKQMVSNAFEDIPNRNAPKPEKAWAGVPPFSNDSAIPSFGSIVAVVPVQDLRQISLSWPIVYLSDRDRKASLLVKQADYVAHLIGHEGPGSLVSYLKRKGWANSLAASSSTEFSDFEAFEVTIELTTQGLLESKSVTEAVFSYINMLRTDPIPDYIFQEVLQLDELGWRFLTKGSPSKYATSLTTAMQKYPPSLYVAGPRRIALAESENTIIRSSKPRAAFSTSEQEALTKALTFDLIDKLTAENVMLTVLSKGFEPLSNIKREKWYGTKYRVTPITEETFNRMRFPVEAAMLDMAYPKPNPFIPSEEGLRVKRPPLNSRKNGRQSFEARMVPVPPPKIIRNDGPEGRWTVYFKQDDRFDQPKAFVVLQLLTKEVYSSPKRAILAQLYQLSAADSLEEYAYDAQLAGLTFDVQVLPRGVRLTFGGYNDKLAEFAAYVSKKLAVEVTSVLPKDESEFDRYKDRIVRGLSAFDVKQPYAHASYYSYLLLQQPGFQYTNAEMRDAIKKVTLFDLLSYVGSLWSAGKGEALVQGNLDEKEAKELVNTIDKTLGFMTIPESDLPLRAKALPLPTKATKKAPTRLIVSEPNPSNENCAAHVVLQNLGATEKDHVMIELLSSIVEEPFFAELRTRQQLGYIVSSGIRALEETRTLAFIAQSSVAPADTLAKETMKFLDSVQEKCLGPLTEGDIAVYAKALIERKTEPDKTLAVEVTRNWAEIASGRLQFDRLQSEAGALLDIRKADLEEFWSTLFYSDESRVLVSEIIPKSGPASSKAPPKSFGYVKGKFDTGSEGVILGIDDLAKFRNDRERMIGVSELPPASQDSVVEEAKDEPPEEKSPDSNEMPEMLEEKAVIESNKAPASEGDDVTETKRTAEKEKKMVDDTEARSAVEKKAKEQLLASPLI